MTENKGMFKIKNTRQRDPLMAEVIVELDSAYNQMMTSEPEQIQELMQEFLQFHGWHTMEISQDWWTDEYGNTEIKAYCEGLGSWE